MNAAVASRHSRLICSIGERRPRERYVPRRHQTGLDLGTARPERGGAPKAIAPGEELEDLGSGGTEGAVAGRILWERWGRKAGGLIGEPRRPVDELRALIRSAPGTHELTAEEHTNRRDRADRVEGSFVVPRTATSVGDRVRQREEELDVPFESVGLIPVVVATRNVLRKEVPVSWGELGARSVGPVLRDHLLFVAQASAQVEEVARLVQEFGGAVPGWTGR